LNISNKFYSLIAIATLGIIIIGVISINIKWTSENLQWDRPYKNSAEKFEADGTLDLNQYAVDNSPIKIFLGSEEMKDLRIVIKDYKIVINKESARSLKGSLERGIKLTNSQLRKAFKRHFNRIVNSFDR